MKRKSKDVSEANGKLDGGAASDEPAYRSQAQRRAEGKRLRDSLPLARHSGWNAPKKRRDPVELVLAAHEGWVLALVPIRHGRMMQSPFAFHRGTAAIMAADLAHTPNSGLRGCEFFTSAAQAARPDCWRQSARASTPPAADRRRGIAVWHLPRREHGRDTMPEARASGVLIDQFHPSLLSRNVANGWNMGLDQANLLGCPCGLFTVRSPRGNPWVRQHRTGHWPDIDEDTSGEGMWAIRTCAGFHSPRWPA